MHITHLWPFSKSKFNQKSDRVHLVAPASLIECLLYLPNVWAILYKLGLERLTRLGNSNLLQLPVIYTWSDKTANSTVVIRTFPSLHREHLEIPPQSLNSGQKRWVPWINSKCFKVTIFKIPLMLKYKTV